jgi:hypothetical protein
MSSRTSSFFISEVLADFVSLRWVCVTIVQFAEKAVAATDSLSHENNSGYWYGYQGEVVLCARL